MVREDIPHMDRQIADALLHFFRGADLGHGIEIFQAIQVKMGSYLGAEVLELSVPALKFLFVGLDLPLGDLGE